MITGKGYTHRGGREYNEDAGMFGKKDGVCYAILADGLGGHGQGGRASRTAVLAVRDCVENISGETDISRECVTKWFTRANQEVMSMQTAACKMKTTLALLCIDAQERRAVIAHLGDSRIYHFVDGKCVFYTFDHSVSRMAVLAGEIEMKDIRFHEDRNRLVKAIGKSEDVTAETDEITLEGGRFHAFLLCTDGFWEYVTEEEMERTLAGSRSAEEWLTAMRRCLARKVKEGNDNNSAIAIWVRDE